MKGRMRGSARGSGRGWKAAVLSGCLAAVACAGSGKLLTTTRMSGALNGSGFDDFNLNLTRR